MSKSFQYLLLLLALVVSFAGCSPTRFLKEDEKLLRSVSLKSDDKAVVASDYRNYIRQEANSRWFNFFKVPLALYSLSGSDSTKAINKMFRRIGEAPRIYNIEATQKSKQALQSALFNKGYLHAKVDAQVVTKGQKTEVTYLLHPGPRWTVRTIRFDFDDAKMLEVYAQDSSKSLLRVGMPMDVAVLSAERSRIVTALQNRGYYLLNKEYVSFKADSATTDQFVDLTLTFSRPAGIDSAFAYQPFHIGKVHIYDRIKEDAPDSSYFRNIWIHTKRRPIMHRRTYANHTALRPDSVYRERDVQRTYSSFNALEAVAFSTVQLQPNYSDSTAPRLDATVLISPAKRQSITTELEGTNTSGDLGAAVALTYSNRNAFRGAEILSLKLRMAYEAISGLEGYDAQSYWEFGGELNLRMPTIQMPFVPQKYLQTFKTFSEVSLQYNSQNRPEFHKRLLSADWNWQWQPVKHPEWRHTWNVIGLNYVFMPWISETFRNNYLDNSDSRYSMLRYSYENILILKMGYGFLYNSSRRNQPNGTYNTNDYQIRFNVETAGNLLYAISRIAKAERDEKGQYTLLNNAFSQYVKFDFDYSKSFLINSNNSVAIHAAFGLAVPYGNTRYMPYEKRYFAGGANSVRGWSVRELGPGSYVEEDGKINFINQTGNIKLDLSVEYRTSLFWKFLGAAFIDAGNIWNIHAYDGLEAGQFKFKKFYKQIAVSYGLGLRFNFDYFILRLDAGMKAIHPAYESGKNRYPIFHPKFKRDFALHFAIGLPF